MIDIMIGNFFSFFSANKYCNDRSYSVDYSNDPRPFYSLAIINEGRGIASFDGRELTIEKNDVLFIPRYSTYACDWLAENAVELFSLHFDFLPQFNPFSDYDVPIQTVRFDNIAEMKRIYDEIFRTQKAGGEQTAVLALFFRYLSEVLPFLEYRNVRSDKYSIQQAIDYIENNYTQTIKVEYLASLCALSPSRFFAKFKKLTGYSPIAYKNKVLINHVAQSLLSHEEKTVEELAYEYGFNSSVYLRRLFKEYFHTSPKAYRKANAKF